MRRWKHPFLVVLLIGVATVWIFATRYSPPANNSLVGKSEVDVVAELGEPTVQFPGHYGLARSEWTKQFTGEIKSAKFKKRGGEIYVSFEKRDGVWYVICNNWLPDGGRF